MIPFRVDLQQRFCSKAVYLHKAEADQGLPRRGRRQSKGRAPTYYFHLFLPKMPWTWKIIGPMGARVPGASLDPTMQSNV